MSAGQVVILRAPEDSGELVAAVMAKGFDALVEPVLSIEYQPADFSDVGPEDVQLPLQSAQVRRQRFTLGAGKFFRFSEIL